MSVGNQIAVVPRAGQQADVRHSNDRQAVPAFGAHRSGRAVQANEVRRFAIRKIAAELPIFNDVRALRGNTFVVVHKGAESLTVVEPGVRDDVHDARSVFQLVQLVERQKTCAGEIRFLTKNTVQLDGMADRFVDLQPELAAAEDEGADLFRALRSGMKRDDLFRDDRRVFHQIERFNEFVTLQRMLAAKTAGIRTLLNFFILKRSGRNSATGNHFALVNARAYA